MHVHIPATALTVPAGHFALQVYSHQLEIFTRLITVLAVVSIGVWACVMVTMLVRLGAHRLYNRQRLRKKL